MHSIYFFLFFIFIFCRQHYHLHTLYRRCGSLSFFGFRYLGAKVGFYSILYSANFPPCCSHHCVLSLFPLFSPAILRQILLILVSISEDTWRVMRLAGGLSVCLLCVCVEVWNWEKRSEAKSNERKMEMGYFWSCPTNIPLIRIFLFPFLGEGKRNLIQPRYRYGKRGW